MLKVNMELHWSDSCWDCIINNPHTYQQHYAAIERELAELQDQLEAKYDQPVDCDDDSDEALTHWSSDEVMIRRTLVTAQSLQCRITQRQTGNRLWEIHPHGYAPVVCFDLPAVRAWLRYYSECGRYGRRCPWTTYLLCW